MAKFVIARSYGYAGTTSYDLIEADSLEDAESQAWEFAIENVESWAQEYDPEEHDGII